MGFSGLDAALDSIVSDTISNSIEMIDIDELYDSADNFFEMDRIDELAESILGQGGVKENLIVCPLENGGYEIISGHRRKAAVQYLIEKGEDVSHFLPCLVQEYSDESDKILNLILMNTSQRVLSDADIMTSFEKLDTILKEKKALGEKFGKTREKIADVLNVSTSQVRKLQNVEKNAIPEVREAVRNGDLSINTADKVASLDEQTQKKVVESSCDKQLTPKDIEKIANEKVVTNDNFDDEEAESDSVDDEKVVTNDNFEDEEAESDSVDDEKVVTNDNFEDEEAESDSIDDEKVVTNDNFEENGIKFRDEQHKSIYESICSQMNCPESCHRAVAYLIAMDNVLRNHVNEVFDFKTDNVNYAVLQENWQTLSSRNTTRLIFNLWNGYCFDEDNGGNSRLYTPFYLFKNLFKKKEYVPYYCQAVLIFSLF